MKLTLINSIILGDVDLPKSSRFTDLPDYTDYINKALILCEGLYNKDNLKDTMSHTEFYKANPMMDATISDWIGIKSSKIFKKELFYAMLCETYVPTVPTELTAMFVLTRRKCETPNMMISKLDKSRLKKYVTQQFHSDKTIMKRMLDILWGYDVNLVTDVRPLVENNNIVEIFIDNINDILLCNSDIRKLLTSTEDVNNLWYSTEKGIVIGDAEIPLRTLIQSFGIVEDDLDLRKVFFIANA